jgi:hypothetical protein
MKTFKIRVAMTTYLETEIEAQDRDNAWDIALNMEGDAFTEILHSGDWKIMDVIEKSEVQK